MREIIDFKPVKVDEASFRTVGRLPPGRGPGGRVGVRGKGGA
jgi:hypothetical protein